MQKHFVLTAGLTPPPLHPAVIETAPPEEGVWYGGPEQPKVNGVVGEGGRCGGSWPFWVGDQMTGVRPSSLRIGWKAALPTQGRYVLQSTSDHPFPWYLVWSRRGVHTWCMHWS